MQGSEDTNIQAKKAELTFNIANSFKSRYQSYFKKVEITRESGYKADSENKNEIIAKSDIVVSFKIGDSKNNGKLEIYSSSGNTKTDSTSLGCVIANQFIEKYKISPPQEESIQNSKIPVSAKIASVYLEIGDNETMPNQNEAADWIYHALQEYVKEEKSK